MLFEQKQSPIEAVNVMIPSDAINSDGEFNPFSEEKGFFRNFFRSGGVFVTFSAAGKSKKYK